MSLSSIAVEQREKEAKKLKSFLAFSLISSLALHIGVLSLGIGNFTKKTAEVKDEPLEIEIVDLPDPQKPEIKQSPEVQDSNSTRVLSSASSEGGSIALTNSTPFRESQGSSPSSKPVKVAPSTALVAEKSPISVAPAKIATAPITQQKLFQTAKTIVTQPAPVAKVTAPSEIATQSKPVITPPPLVAASPKPAPTQKAPAPLPSPIASQPENNQKLRNLLASTRNTQQENNTSTASKPSNLSDRQASIANSLRNQRANGAVDGTANGSSIGTGNNLSGSLSNRIGSGSGTGTGEGSGSGSVTGRGSGSGSGSGSGTGRGSGSGTGRGRGDGSGSGSGSGTGRGSGSTVATGTQNRPRTQPESNSNANSSSGGLACRSCSKPKYPDKARRRGLEGKAEIRVDVDSKGNVTDVRLARSSGHSELDKAALQQARRWKFKAPNGGARGVSAKVDFAIEGSERSRQLRERRKRRQTEQRRTPTTETVNAPTSTRRIRNSTSTQNASSPRRTQTTTSRRRIDTLPPRRAGETRQRPTTQQASSQTRLRQSLRRQRPTSNQATPASQTALRQSLRQLRQNPQPVANPND